MRLSAIKSGKIIRRKAPIIAGNGYGHLVFLIENNKNQLQNNQKIN
ncbi:hypothetical protein HYT53_05920 [Candidatus Woesearchaeota archaeon]|nr:hypothetical protein [Candidatus Woesearchaeota archaeon]